MIRAQLNDTVFNQHGLKKAITVSESSVINRYLRICTGYDLTIEVDVIQE